MIRTTCALALACLVSGCASWTHLTKDLGSPSTGVAIDIKQRMLLINKHTDSKKHEWARLCAEPSPDALSSLGASVGASFLRPGGSSAQLGGSVNEAAAFIGLRTQSIQLMRDAMYRACEAYMSGALESDDYLFLQRRFQAQVVGLLAIEQLTGTIAAQPISVHTNTSASVGGGASEEVERLAAARKQLAEQKVKQAASKQAADDAKRASTTLDTEAKKFADKADSALTEQEAKTRTDAKEAATKYTKAKDQLALDDTLVSLYEDAVTVADDEYKQAKGRIRTANSGGSTVPIPIAQRQVSDAAVATVAGSVERIVGGMFKVAFNDESGRCLRKLYTTPEKFWNSQARLCLALATEEFADAKKAVSIEQEAAIEKDRREAALGTSTPKPEAGATRPATGDKPAAPGSNMVKGGATKTPPGDAPKVGAGEIKPLSGKAISTSIGQARLESAERLIGAITSAIEAGPLPASETPVGAVKAAPAAAAASASASAPAKP